MALTLKRWMVIALLSCAIIAVWLLPSRGAAVRSGGRTAGGFAPDYGYVRRYGWPGITTKLQAATLHLRILELRDSLFDSPATPATPGLHIIVDRQFPDSIRRSIRGLLEAAWSAYSAGTRYPVEVAVVQDTTRVLDGLPMATTSYIYSDVFPPDSATPVCRVLARIRVSFRGGNANSNMTYARNFVAQQLADPLSGRTILGPCAMYATFGRPGPGVSAWLRETGWRAGRTIAWGRQSPAWNGVYFARYRNARPLVDITGRSSRAWQMRYKLTNDGIACVSGEDARCVSGLERPAIAIPGEQEWQARVVEVRAPAYMWPYEATGSLGPSSEWILSDMVHDLGRDRFQRFWSSPDTLPVAFQEAAGTSLGAWLARWARRTYGPDVLGPSIPERTRMAGMLGLIAGLVAAAVFASERHVA